MDRINQILCHPLFIKYMNKNADMELDRIFCKHNLEHVLEVARIADILTNRMEFTVENRARGDVNDLIAAAALLHDIGRHVQYETGEKHGIVSARLAPTILEACGYTAAEIETIVDAIRTHSDKKLINDKSLNGILAKADMLSRNCSACKAKDKCNWSEEAKKHPMI